MVALLSTQVLIRSLIPVIKQALKRVCMSRQATWLSQLLTSTKRDLKISRVVKRWYWNIWSTSANTSQTLSRMKGLTSQSSATCLSSPGSFDTSISNLTKNYTLITKLNMKCISKLSLILLLWTRYNKISILICQYLPSSLLYLSLYRLTFSELMTLFMIV